MQTRQMLLYGVLAAVVLYVMGGEQLIESLIDGPLKVESKRKKKLEKDLKKAKKEFALARKTGQRIADWEIRSLPGDPEVARSLYQAWLVDVVTRAGLTDQNIQSGSPIPRKGIYHSLSFSVRIRGTLNQMTKFLYEFYRADYLHQIQSIGITPLRNAGLLDLSISIEALVLRSAKRTNHLSTAVSKEFAQASLSDYDPIVRRNVFGIGGGVDAAAYTFLTGVAPSKGEPEAWFTMRTDGKVLKLRRGENLQVGQFSGTIAEIQGSDVILEADGERWLISVGENLDQATALPPEF